MKQPSHYLETMRARAPLVQNITNYVAMNVMANVLLAAGASPAMVHAREEAAEFAGLASVLTINIGTIDGEWAEAMVLAAEGAVQNGTPWILDPVAVGATQFRREEAKRLLALKPTVIRGNASEIIALSGGTGAGKGADSADSVDAAENAARNLAGETGAVVAVTGAVDFVTDGTRAARIENGTPLMAKVTAIGCSLTGIVGAFVAGGEPFENTVGALSYFGVAGEIGAETANGPASFQTAFIDALYNLKSDALDERARIETT